MRTYKPITLILKGFQIYQQILINDKFLKVNKIKSGYNVFMKIIDTHIHGAFGVNFNFAEKKEIVFLLNELKKRNVVGICPTFTGDSKENLQRQFKILSEIKQEQKAGKTGGAYIIGAHLEGTFLSPNKAGIQDPKDFLEPTVENFKKIAGDFEEIIKIVTLAPELDKENKLTNYLEEKNIKAHSGHTTSTNSGKTSATTHHFNAMPPICHRGENLALDAILSDIYCEIIADCTHTSENMLRLFFKAKNHDKIIMISDALPCTKGDIDIIFCGKKISKEGKDKTGKLAGSVLLLDEIVDRAIKKGIIKSDEAEKFVYKNVLSHLNLSDEDEKMLEK